VLKADITDCHGRPFNQAVRVGTMPLLNSGAAVRRGDFISLFGGVAAIPFVAHAEQSERGRHAEMSTFDSKRTNPLVGTGDF